MFPGMGHLPPLWASCGSVIPLIIKNVCHIPNQNQPFFSLKPLPMQCCIATDPAENSVPIFLINPFKYREAAIRSTWRLPFFTMKNPNYLSLSSWERGSSSPTNFISLFWTCCRRSTSSSPELNTGLWGGFTGVDQRGK